MFPLEGRFALRGRWVLPVERPPLAHGVVIVDHGRISSVQPSAPNARDCRLYDLGNVAILPGLVNAHVHLNFSHFERPLGEPGMSFADWLEMVVQWQRGGSLEEMADAERRAIAAGLKECRRYGTTTVGNIAHRGADIPVCQRGTSRRRARQKLDRFDLLELIGLSLERSVAQRRQMHNWLSSARVAAAGSSDRWQYGVSPHAPYTCRRELIAAACASSRLHHFPVAMHLAESPEELELLDRQSGPLVDLLRRLDAWDSTALEPGLRPWHYLDLLAQAERALVIHGNYLNAAERAWLAGHADRVALVYCPRTHSYFGHPRYPLAELLAAGVTLALGTDGRGSNPDLSLLAEMRHIARTYSDVSPNDILRLGTLGGATALGCGHRTGSLTPGKDANLVVVQMPEHDAQDPTFPLLHLDTDVLLTIYRGRVVHPRRIPIEDRKDQDAS